MSAKNVMCPPFNASLVRYTRPLLEIEQNFDNCRAFTWLGANWTLCYYFLAAYLLAIFGGRKWMESRPPFQIRGALFFWNVMLAVYSIVSTWRLLPALFYTIKLRGFYESFCSMGQEEEIQAMGLWLFLASISKLVEFGDTVFIVLRKSPLTFLHWFHHLSVAYYCWFSSPYPSPMHTYFTVINLLVHSIMYSYYALKVLGVRIPKVISISITSLQLMQMVAGVLITCYAHRRMDAEPSCSVDEQAITISASMYLAYFVLFLNFFNKSYIIPRMKPATTCYSTFKKISLKVK